MAGLSIAAKNELLFQHGTNVNDLPGWQKRGIGFYWETSMHAGFNPKINEATTTVRRRLHGELHLPLKDSYDAFLRTQLGSAPLPHVATEAP